MVRLMKAPLCGVHAGGAFSIYQSQPVVRKSHEEGVDWPIEKT